MATSDETTRPRPDDTQALKRLLAAGSACPPRQRDEFTRRIKGLQRRLKQGQPIDRSLGRLTAEINQAAAQVEARRENLPRPEYPAELPVVQRREDILAAIEGHQVIVLCGETGSGKTTQLPKLCLELGRGVLGRIGHTQPRRIAARSLAARIADELNSDVGHFVGFKVRFQDQVGPQSYIKVMTDGILLAETQGDPELLEYDTLIIDEAHERSLNIDLLLGYLKRLLPKRPDLKVIITSATIDPERFSRHFNDAPIIEVSGRTYPVEVRYRPLMDEDEDGRDRDRGSAILDAIDELARLGPGDVLVFLPGEREIRETAELLRKHHPPGTEILPLYGRLSASQQQQVFKAHSGRRIVLATNVAETSLTVPGIRYVVDTGLARISRYSYRTKVQRLPIEAISQASANQRAGRCGRVAPGVCIRLYSEDDYAKRPEHTQPEILRANLANVCLHMLSLGLGAIEDFPFIDPPDGRYVRDGLRLLNELNALDEHGRLTRLGRELARLPIDVRLARMLLAGRDEGALDELLVITAALSVPDPRERPMDKAQAADQKHARFKDEDSDFMALLKIWNWYHDESKHLSQNKRRLLCASNFISYVRLRDWHDIHGQLTGLTKDLGLKRNEQEAGYDAIHRALLAGLLSNVATQGEEREYIGARGLKMQLFPGSGLAKKRPKWIIAGEIIETSRTWAANVARIQPEWVEAVGAHLVKRSHYDPHWEKKSGRVGAFERVTLYGLTLVGERRVNYGPIDPEGARELFIRHALVRGEWGARHPFVAHNRKLIAEIEQLEAKARRRDLLAEEDEMEAWFAERLPAGIHDTPRFERWWKKAGEDERDALKLPRDLLLKQTADIDRHAFPDFLAMPGLRLPLNYHFEPGGGCDGVSARLPLAALNQLDPRRLEWLVPGLLADKVTALIKSLPKALRRNFVPAPDFAREASAALCPPGSEPAGDLLERLCAELTRMTGVAVHPRDFRPEALADHLHLHLKVVNADGRVQAEGRDIEELRARLAGAAVESFRDSSDDQGEASPWDRDQVTQWDFDELPASVTIRQAGVQLNGYPALVCEGEGLALRLLDHADKAQAAHRAGLIRLFRLSHARLVKDAGRAIPRFDRMALCYTKVGKAETLRLDIIDRLIDESLFETVDRAEPAKPNTAAPPNVGLPRVSPGEHSTDIRDAATWAARSEAASKALLPRLQERAPALAESLDQYRILAKQIGSPRPQWLAAIQDIRTQLDGLIYAGFARHTPSRHWPDLGRYLAAIGKRLEKIERDPGRDRKLQGQYELYQFKADKLRERVNALPPQAPGRAAALTALDALRWLLEEYRVSLFAQEIRTASPVSPKRLDQALAAIHDLLR